MILAPATFAVTSIYPIRAFAVESISLPLQMMRDDVVSISLPVISESETSVFDFILDPQGLLYETDAVRYGGGRVEEGATLLFYNKEGEYDFSGHSDWLTVTNRSTVPVHVTVTAQIMDLGDISLSENEDFGESTEPEIYLAIEDDQGNVLPLYADEQTTIDLEMLAAPENTYVFRLDKENHTYEYGMSMDPGMVDFDTYSFALTGACNPNAEWRNTSVYPTITVTWSAEPIIPEEQEEISEEVFAEEENEGAADDDIEKDVPVDGSDDENSEDNTSGDSDDEGKSDDESDEKKDEGNGSGGSDDENQSNNGPDDKNGENNADGGIDNENQSDDEPDDNNSQNDNGQNKEAGGGTAE